MSRALCEREKKSGHNGTLENGYLVRETRNEGLYRISWICRSDS